MLEEPGLLSVGQVEAVLFTQPVLDETPLGQFFADMPWGIHYRLYDLGNADS
jgi:hypothetical protein